MDQGMQQLINSQRDARSEDASAGAHIVVAGIGGGGTNAVNRMIAANVQGVAFLAMNTDAQALEGAHAEKRLRLGPNLTRGLGAGGNPAIGAKAAEESYATIREALSGADMVFITAGMGGGTGTGASPIVAQAARELGALTVAVVTTPFGFERRRHQLAQEGLAALREAVDALIVVPNERLMQLASRDTSAFEAYRFADDVLRLGIQGISDLITVPGLINLDFADIRAVMADAGTAFMSMSEASGENRAETLTRAALANPLLETDIKGARGLIFNITGGDDLTMHEVGRIADLITSAAHPEANVIFGTVYEPASEGKLKLTIVATGFEPRVVHNGPQAAAASGRIAHAPVPATTTPSYGQFAQAPHFTAPVAQTPQPPMPAPSSQPVVPTPATPVLLDVHRDVHRAQRLEAGAMPAGPVDYARAAEEYPAPHATWQRPAAPEAGVTDDYRRAFEQRAVNESAFGSAPLPRILGGAGQGPLPPLQGYPEQRGITRHYVAEEYAEDAEDDGQLDEDDDAPMSRTIWERFFPHR